MSTKEQKERIELLQSMLELLILRTLLPGRRTPCHRQMLQVEQSSLYPAL